MPAWEDRDGDGHKELSGEVAPVATVVGIGAGVASAGLGVVAGVTATGAAIAAATVVGLPVALPLGVVAGVTATGAAAAGGVAVAAGGVAYFAERYDWEYSIEPGSVIEGAKDKASDIWEGSKDKAGDAIDWLREGGPFDSDGPPFPGGPVFSPFVNKVGGQASGMRRLDEAFARLQNLL